MRVELSPRFKREYKKLSSEDHERTKKAVELFVKDRNHPSLRFKKSRVLMKSLILWKLV